MVEIIKGSDDDLLRVICFMFVLFVGSLKIEEMIVGDYVPKV